MASQPHTSSAPYRAPDLSRERWTAEVGPYGFWMVVNQDAVVVAQHCVAEEARLIAAAPLLLKAVREAVETYRGRLSLLDDERPWRDDDEYRDMKGHYGILLQDAQKALGAVR